MNRMGFLLQACPPDEPIQAEESPFSALSAWD
jgi:hypothetical protein